MIVPLAIQDRIANTIVAVLAMIMEVYLPMELAPVIRVGKLPRAQRTRNVHRLCVKEPTQLEIITSVVKMGVL